MENLFYKIGYSIKIPRFISNSLRTQEEIDALDTKKFDSAIQTIKLIGTRLSELKTDNEEVKEELNKKGLPVDIMTYSKFNEADTDQENEVLQRSVSLLKNDDKPKGIDSFIINENNYLNIDIIRNVEGSEEKKYAILSLSPEILKDINFVTNKAGVQIKWNEAKDAYEVLPSDLLIIESDPDNPQAEYIIDHNLGTRALFVEVYKLIEGDLMARVPINCPVHHNSDNQIQLYLTAPTGVTVLIKAI